MARFIFPDIDGDRKGEKTMVPDAWLEGPQQRLTGKLVDLLMQDL